MGDLHWMRQNGLEAAVKKLAAHIPVWGICGGYQMLGRTISDPHGVENENSLREPLYPLIAKQFLMSRIQLPWSA